MNKKILILGGGTVFHVRPHLALCAPAYGKTARQLAELTRELIPEMDTELFLSRMAGEERGFETNEDVAQLLSVATNLTEYYQIIFMSAALCDFEADIRCEYTDLHGTGKDLARLSSKLPYTLDLTPAEKIIKNIRKDRKDIFLVGFKTTAGATEQEQYLAGLNLLKTSSCNLVLANDVHTRLNMVITPEEAKYHVTINRAEALRGLVEMSKLRSHLSFTRSTVVAGEPVAWDSELVPSSLRTVVNYCIEKNAYKPFNGSTVGHFACKVGDKTFLTSRRKTNFNDLDKLGLVKVEIDGQDSVIAYGSKPSVGGQSQRIIFNDHDEYDCIVHAHVPIREGSEVPQVSQREYECGSHECGKNTSNGLKKFGNLSAVFLKEHGFNVVFHHSINPQEVIDFITENFILEDKTGGSVS